MLRCSFVPVRPLIVLSFYGITSIQAFLYFQRPKEQSDGWKYAVLVRLHATLRNYPDLTSTSRSAVYGTSDPWRAILVVAYRHARILDTIHLAFVCDAGYHYLIDNYANPVALATANWCVSGHAGLARR